MGLALIDLLVLGALLLFALLGLVSGFLVQLFSIAALTAAWFLSRPVGRVIGDFIDARSDTPPSAAYVIGCLLAGLAIYTGVKLLFRIVNHFIGKPQGALRATDRLLGGAFGATKAFVIAWLLLCVVAAFPQYFQNKKPDVYTMLDGSQMGRLIEKWNPVAESRFFGGVRGLRKVLSRDPKALERLKDDPHVAEFLSVVKKKLVAAAPDEATRQKIQAGDLSTFLDTRTLLGLMHDPEVVEAIRKVDLSAAMTTAAAKTGGEEDSPQTGNQRAD